MPVMLISTDGQPIPIGFQIEGQPTCAIVVSRNDYHKTIKLLRCEDIGTLSYLVENSQVRYYVIVYCYMYITANYHSGFK